MIGWPARTRPGCSPGDTTTSAARTAWRRRRRRAWVASSRSSVAAHAGALGIAVDREVGRMCERLNASDTGHIAFDPNPSASRW